MKYSQRTRTLSNRSKRRQKIVRVLATLFFAIFGICLFFKQDIERFIIRSTMHDVTAKKIAKNIKANKSSQEEKTLAEYSQSFLSKFENTQKDLSLVGLISIPDLSIHLPIFNGTSDAAITYGAGTVSDYQMGEANYSLSSHRVFDGSDNRLFSPLQNAKQGMKIYTTNKSTIYVYEVYEVFEVDQYDVQILDPIDNETVITLITCKDLDAQYRIIVRGRLVSKTDYHESDEESRQAFERDFNL